MIKSLALSCLSLLLSISFQISAQKNPVKYRNVGLLEDYSHFQTWCLFQDSKGLIWIGTQNGLERWDGTRMLSYPYSFPFDSTEIPSQTLWSITEDDQNNLWIGDLLTNGIIKFDMEAERFSLINLTKEPVAILPTQVQYDPGGYLWVGGRDGLHRYYPEADSFHHVKVELPEKGEKEIQIRSIDFDTTGRVWVTDRQMYLYYLNRERDVLIPFNFSNPDIPHLYANAFKMSMDADGNFWMLGTRSELIYLNPYERTIELVKPEDTESISWLTDGGIQVDRHGDIWYGMGRGLMHYDPETGISSSLENTERPNVIRDILEDDQGNILVATREGVKIVDKRASRIIINSSFKNYLVREESWIREVVRKNQTYWLRTYGKGLIKYNKSTGETKVLREGGPSGGLASDRVTQVLKDRKGGIWVASGCRHLQRYDPEYDDFELIPFPVSPFLTQDKEGFFWNFENSRLQRFDPITMDTINILLRNPITELGVSSGLFACAIDPRAYFWLGGIKGLYRIETETGNWTRYTNNREDPLSFPDNEVQALFCDSRNRIWAGTTIGLFQLFIHPDSDSLSYRKILHEGKSLGAINKVIEDDLGNIWIASYAGLYCMDRNKHVKKYTYKDGLPGDPKNIALLDIDEGGTIYAGMYDLAEIPPAFLKPNAFIPSVMLTDLSMDGERIIPGMGSILKKSMRFTEKIDLRHNQNFFRIDFAALNYEDSERNQYQYILHGVDRDTIHMKGKAYAEYTDLGPGKYTFWATGSNNTGIWNTEGKSIEIHIHPPWYRSVLAYAIYCSLLIILLIGIIRLRTSRLQRVKTYLETEVENRTIEITKKNQQILELDTLKTRFFNNISHEFRSLVTMVKAPAETLLEEEKISHKGHQGLEVIYRNANKLMKLVSQLLDISRIDKKSMKLRLSRENLFDLAHAIAVSFASLAEVRGILYQYYLPRTDSLEWIDADKFEKILNNLLSNAFKFTNEGGQVRFEVSRKNQGNSMGNLLEITVSDTGEGILEEEQNMIFDRFYQAESNLKKEGGGTGIGLALTKELVELMHGTITLVSKQGKGSTFTIKIPLELDRLSADEYTFIESSRQERGRVSESPSFTETRLADFPSQSKEEKKPVLLVVEDNADIRWFISSTMRSEFSILEAVDGSAGQKLAIEYMPDLVITDLMMPRMDGFEFCEKLKMDVRTSHIPVIMLTAKASTDDKMLGLETGADDYITKPFDIKEVLARSRNLVEQRRKLREKFSTEITLDPLDIVINSTDEKFIKKAMNIIERQMGNDQFDVAELSKEMNMSQSTLFRKMGALTNQTPVEFIRTLRLKRAAVMLKGQYGNVSEVALEVGFSNPSYFAKMFKKAFLISPSRYAKS